MRRHSTVFPFIVFGLFVALAGLVPDTADAGKRVFKVKDPRGDADGDGSFLFPETIDNIQQGELDMVQFSAKQVSGGTEFEVVFARPVRQPYRRAIDGGGTQLSDIARHGFYTFNIDVYIDTDREPGSGQIVTLPGRVAEVHGDFAWERVVCVTPRPNMARSQLRRILLGRAKREHKAEQGTVVRRDVQMMSEQIQLDVADHTFFATRINVVGPKIRFFVPDTFLGGQAEASWAYVVAVSAPDLISTAQTQPLEAGILEVGRPGLMILPIRPGGQRFTLGSREPDTEMLPPLLDIIVPEGATQREVLRSFDVLAEQPARLLGVVPGS